MAGARVLTTATVAMLVAVGPITGAFAQPATTPVTGEAIFNLFANSSPAGVERVSLERTETGWRVSSTGQFFPLDLENQLLQIDYDEDWLPQQLSIDATRRGEAFSLETAFGDGIAESELVEGYERRSGSLQVPATAVVLPDYFFGAFEVLAVRLARSVVGDEIAVFSPPITQFTAVVDELVRQEIRTVGREISARIYRLTFRNDETVSDAEVWVDQDDRLLRVSLPRQGLEVARQDIVLVSTRLSSARVPGDAEVRVGTSGFSLAAAVTTPPGQQRPREGWPAVLLVPGTRSVDRDEQQFGVPFFARLAEQLSNAGYLVVRYDKRGVGRSGGRPESASLDDYADDVRAIVRYLDRRDDVDEDRIVVVGHGEGGWVALRASAQEKRIDGLVLIATPATPGTTLVLEQQTAELDRLNVTAPDERAERIALQTRIHEAVLGSGSWDGIPDRIRRQADTAWFRSFLTFEPMEVMRRTRQPVLILHGDADAEVAIHHADRLEELAAVRTRDEATVRVERLTDVDHVLRPTNTDDTGGPDDDDDSIIAPTALSALIEWLAESVEPRS